MKLVERCSAKERDQDDKNQIKDEEAHVVVLFLNWCFRTTILRFIAVASLQFYALNIFFATIIFVYESYLADFLGGGDSSCLSSINATTDTDSDIWAHSFALSWTTFSTVGYGKTFPTLQHNCYFLSIVASTESLVGVLFASFCGAILFGKVTEMYARAMVTFSEVTVVRFGTGVQNDDVDDDFQVVSSSSFLDSMRDGSMRGFEVEGSMRGSISSIDDVDIDPDCSPFPILVFRVVNDLANEEGGNIIDVNLEASAVVYSERNLLSSNTSATALGKRNFEDLSLVPSTVPLFERVLYVRHVLNSESPLLSNTCKNEMITEHNGKWPKEFDSYNFLRNNMNFQSIVITLKGVSDISKSDVTQHKTYTLEDLKIGWQFVGITYTDKDRKDVIKVDFDRLNWLIEQDGGGGESLSEEMMSHRPAS